MPRGIYSPEGEFLRKLHREKMHEKSEDEPPEEEEKPEEELPEEKEARQKIMKEAAARYETGVGKKPVKIETGKQAAPILESEIEQQVDKERKKRARESWTWGMDRRGHRRGGKPERPKGGETIREKKAA